jgi:hypothetical protein
MRFILCFCAGLVLATALTSDAQAARVWLDTVGFGGVPTVGRVPVINLEPGQSVTLHVWTTVGPGVGGPAITTRERLQGLSFDLNTSSTGVVQGTNHVVVNPTIDGDPGSLRWDGVVGGLSNTGNRMLISARGFSVTATGIDSGGNGRFDDMIEPTTGARYFSTLTIQATTPGQTGLYFRVSEFGSAYVGGNPAVLYFGNSTTSFLGNQFLQGDPITADLASAHAIINVAGTPPPTRKLTINPAATATHTLNVNSGKSLLGINAQSGVLQISNHPPADKLHLFLDLLSTNLDALVAELGGMAGIQSATRINGSPFLGSANVQVVFSSGVSAGGGPIKVDFDFGTGNSLRAAAVPEPSSFVLASMGLVGLAGYLRRRRRVSTV